MTLFGGVIPITGISFLMFCLLAVAFVGYALGRITIKGVNLGTAGVFIVALLFGCFFYEPLMNQLAIKEGSEVRVGEVIAEANGGLSVPQHASLTGKITLSGNKIRIDKG